jgi:Fic family protein
LQKKNDLTGKNLLKAHEILSKQILIRSKRGQLREERIGVFDPSGLVYLAVEPENVKTEIKKLFDDIKYLKQINLSIKEIFYYASFIHLIFAHIHPFMDGNGRAARLLEKWFLSTRLGVTSWKVRSEKYYFENRSRYYRNINLGQNYYELNYKNCLPFLEMLPKTIK